MGDQHGVQVQRSRTHSRTAHQHPAAAIKEEVTTQRPDECRRAGSVRIRKWTACAQCDQLHCAAPSWPDRRLMSSKRREHAWWWRVECLLITQCLLTTKRSI